MFSGRILSALFTLFQFCTHSVPACVRVNDIWKPIIVNKMSSFAKPHTDHNCGWTRPLFGPGLLPNHVFFECLKYHLVQIIDEIRHLCVGESLVSTLFVVRDPTLELQPSRHEKVVESRTATPGIGLTKVPLGPFPTTILTSVNNAATAAP